MPDQPLIRRGLLEATPDPRVGRRLALRSLVFDILVAGLFIAVGLLLLEVFTQRPTPLDRTFVVLVNLPLAFRRRLPRSAFLLSYGFGVGQIVLGSRIGMHDAGLLYALYSAVGASSPRFGLVALVVAVGTVIFASFTRWWAWVDRQLVPDPGVGTRLASLSGALVLVGCSWALGRRLFSARLGATVLAERAERAEREQRQQVALAAAAERARIAREMHDVIAHGLSVMVVQADAASFVVEQNPADARRAIEQIATTGRESMAQMRTLLGLLREGDTERTSSPGLDDLPELVERARQAGSTVTLQQAPLGPVPPLVALTAYRVVQEGLTNARKHGGTAVLVQLVQVQQQESGGEPTLLVRVINEARDGGQTGSSEPPPSGLGLRGARERTAAVSGTLTTGRDTEGRFVLTAELPLHDGAARLTP